mmetsp:Transcript_17926/g.44098  ORF Transcript_17926/g.44098 Transcript_17926/m.44098 type:complete len:86 (+) Transcript_17926:92-349(+)
MSAISGVPPVNCTAAILLGRSILTDVSVPSRGCGSLSSNVQRIRPGRHHFFGSGNQTVAVEAVSEAHMGAVMPTFFWSEFRRRTR